MKTTLILGIYFSTATTALAMVFLPGARAVALGGWRWAAGKATSLFQAAHGASDRSWARASHSTRLAVGSLAGWCYQRARALVAALAVLVLLPLIGVAWRYWDSIETFDHTDVRVHDERIAALLAGERLVPPAPLPPDVFTTREVELVRPMARYASRDWDLLDPAFAQRLLVVYRVMREQHGYEMVFLEGYRSPQRQAHLASLGGHVTQAGAFRSYHQFGLAADSAFLRNGQVVISEQDSWALRGYALYGQVAESMGLTWGGGWKTLKDFGHVELRRPGVLRRGAGDATPTAAYVY